MYGFTKAEMEEKVLDVNGREIYYLPAVMLMDDELREMLHDELSPCSNQEFIEEYARRHKEKFGEDFAPYVGGNW